jgi:uncharacterized iron-regulated membrane protein
MTSANWHRLVGFWISLPLAIVSATGIYIAFPQTAHSVTSSVMETTQQGGRHGAGEVVRDPALTPDRALAIARMKAPGTIPAAISLPTRSAGRAEGQAAANWRVDLRDAHGPTATIILVDDRAAISRRLAEPPPGDRAAQWIRWVHEGSHTGSAWRLAVFVCGLCPTLLAITGLTIWLRGRTLRRVDKRPGEVVAVGAAE